jgi:hypothetical protein
MNTRKLYVAILVAVTMIALQVGPVLALQPEIIQLHLYRYFDDFAICDGYSVIGDFDVTRQDVTFFDNSGNPIRIYYFVHYVGTLTNSVTGKTLDDRGDIKNSADLVNGTFTQTGGLRHTTASGLGIVIQETGRIILEDATGGILFVTPGMSGDENSKLCAALK